MFTHELKLNDASMAIVRRAAEYTNASNAAVPDYMPIDETGWIMMMAGEVIKAEQRRQINEDADIARRNALRAAGLE